MAATPTSRASLVTPYDSPLQSALRALLTVVTVGAAAVVLVAALALVQGRYADLRHADAVLLLDDGCGLGPDCADPAAVDYALTLFRRGMVDTLIVAGPQPSTSLSYLRAKGLPDAALLTPDDAPSRWERAQSAADRARTAGVSSVLVVAVPSGLLLNLKMARDLGLSAYAAPLPKHDQSFPDLTALLAESLSYWRYVLLGQ